MNSSSNAAKGNQHLSSSAGNTTRNSPGVTVKETHNSGTSGQDGQIYTYKYRGRIVSAEEAATLDPMETMRVPGIEPPPEHSSPTKCHNVGYEEELGIGGIKHGTPMPFRRWDGKTRDHIGYICYECWVALGHPYPEPPVDPEESSKNPSAS